MVIEVQWIESMYPEVYALLAAMDKRQRAEQVRVWCQSAVLATHAEAGAVARVPTVVSISERQRDPHVLTGESSDASHPFGAIEAPDFVLNLMR